MIGIVDVGDGMRGSFGAGVVDYCLDNGIDFDEYIGVSSGATNLGALASKQHGWSYRYYCSHSFRPAYMGWAHKFRNDEFFNREYIFSTLAKSNGETPYDYDAMAENEHRFVIPLTDADIGETVYFEGSHMRKDDYGLFKASWSIPWFNTPYFWAGYKLFDGGISYPIPAKAALNNGCDKVVVILSLPRNYYRSGFPDRFFARLFRYTYPDLAVTMARRATIYNQQLEECKAMEKDGRVLIVSPSRVLNMSPLSRNPLKLRTLYNEGYAAGKEITAFLS